MSYRIIEVDGTDPDVSHRLRSYNSMVPEWPALEEHHLKNGFWWIFYSDFGFGRPVGFCGMVPFVPCEQVGYLKRCYILPEHRGNGLHIRSMFVREAKAKSLGWRQLVSECTSVQSAGNFRKAGYAAVIPEQK